jgi:hypothetical protein
MGRRAHTPDPAQRKQVEAMAAYGIPEIDIAGVIGIDPKTLRKCYRQELDLGETKANAQVAGFLFNSARNGNVSAQIFWLKTRARWREVPTELRHSGAIGRKDIYDYSDDELLAIVMSAASSSLDIAAPKAIESSRSAALGKRLRRSHERAGGPAPIRTVETIDGNHRANAEREAPA